METFIKDRYDNYEVLTGEVSAPEPSILCFYNARKACNMLYKHLQNKSGVLIHSDVDCDGIGATYIAHRFLCEFGMRNRIGTCINKDKIHGITENHIGFFNSSGAGLILIVDSATNDIEYIKQLNCDVLVVDHHEVLHNELTGKTAGGEYIIVNNTIDNEDVEFGKYTADNKMSGAMVLYELLRLYQHTLQLNDLLKARMLYQWVGLTLFTDAVSTTTLRNQYYLDLTVHNMDTEENLKKIMRGLSKYQGNLDKSFINYQVAPAFNRAIRAGYSALALNYAINTPEKVHELLVFREIQDEICKDYMSGVSEYSQYAVRDITDDGIHKNYCGLLATKILNHCNKTTVVYTRNGDYAEGSFRGKHSSVEYRKFIDEWSEDTFAQGHKAAFGFKVKLEELPQILLEATNLEKGVTTKEYLTAGRMLEEYKGIHHIDDFDAFKKAGLLWRLSVANSKLSTEESINIVIANDNLEPTEQRGKVLFYEVFGLKCQAFEQLQTPLLEIYVEYTKEMKVYIRNKW